MISILILTRNEENNISTCLESVKSLNDVVVLDSMSEDGTIEIARRYGVRIYTRCFDDYASQRNYGLHNIEYKNEWILMLDADEVLDGTTLVEIEEKISNLP